LSSQFVSLPKITFRDPNEVATHSLRSPALGDVRELIPKML